MKKQNNFNVEIFKNWFNKYREDLIAVFILIILSLVSHFEWFFTNNTLTYGDLLFRFNEYINGLYSSYNTWLTEANFGQPNIQLYFFVPRVIGWCSLSLMGLSFDVALRIVHLIPIALLNFIAPYILSKKLIKNKLIAFVCALFYGSNVYLLSLQESHIAIAFPCAIAPLVFFLFIKSLEKNKLINWIIFVLVYALSGFYELRITYVVSLFLLLYFCINYFQSIKKYYKNILISILIFLLLNSFWIFPNLFTKIYIDIYNVANRGLFGDWLYSMMQSFTIFIYKWTGSALNSGFSNQPILWYFWGIPIIVILPLFFKKTIHRKKILTFWIIALIGIFLTKQSSKPFESAYNWMYKNIPTFNLFRTASRLYILTALSYLGLLNFSLLLIKEKKEKIIRIYLFYFLITIVIIFSLWNLKPLISREFGGMLVPRNIPNDYLILKDFILKQPEYFKTFWTPVDSRWGFYIDKKPKISNFDIIQSSWNNLLKTYNENDKQIQDRIINVFKTPFSNNLFDISSIKYVIIPIQDTSNDDDFFIHYGEEKNTKIRDWYISRLSEVDYLKKIDIGTKEIMIFENENYRPHIYTTKEKETIYWEVPFEKVNFIAKNPAEYEVNLKNIKRTTYLNFSESFHPDWKLRAGKFEWFDVLIQKNYFLPDDFHFENNANLNTFKVDPDFIKKNYPGSYIENSDGSINVDLTLYFKPQSYFYLGLIISSTTLVGCLIYLLYALLKSRKEKT